MKKTKPKLAYKIPKEIILDKNLPECRTIQYCYLQGNITKAMTIPYSLESMMNFCGYKWNPTKGRSKSNTTFTKILICMEHFNDNGYLYDFDKECFTVNNYNSVMFSEEKMNPSTNYGIVYDFEISNIMDFLNSNPEFKTKQGEIFLLLSYIRAFCFMRKNLEKEYLSHAERSKQEKPEIFCSNFKTMAFYLGMTEKSVSKWTDVLEDSLGIIKTHRIPKYKDTDGNWHTSDVVYVFNYKYLYSNNNFILDTEYDPDQEIKNGIKFIRENQYETKKFNQE